MKVTITSTPGQPYRHELKAGAHTIVSDVDSKMKGGDLGPTPHELFLLSLGTCAAMTMEMYAARKALAVTKVTITVEEDKVDDPDGSGTKIPRITETIEIEGNLTDTELAKLKEIGSKCPVLLLFLGKKVVESSISLVTST